MDKRTHIINDASIINAYYQNADMPHIVGQQLSKDSVLQLQTIFKENFCKELLKHIKNLNYERQTDILTHNYLIAKIGKEFESLLNLELSKFLSGVCRKKIMDITFRVLCMEWKDYTLMHDKEKKHQEIIIDLLEWDDQNGGNIVYSDDEGNHTTISSTQNSLIISDGRMQKFIKYINHNAKHKRYLIIGEI